MGKRAGDSGTLCWEGSPGSGRQHLSAACAILESWGLPVGPLGGPTGARERERAPPTPILSWELLEQEGGIDRRAGPGRKQTKRKPGPPDRLTSLLM